MRERHPELVADFVRTLDVFRTSPQFSVVKRPALIPADELKKLRAIIQDIAMPQLELHEAMDFGRIVVHNHDIFNRLQGEFTAPVSDWAGEEVEPSYNFLSLYSRLGVCPVHMDAPAAKWTLDICIDQSVEWPIYIGPVRDWPENLRFQREDAYEAYEMKPGDGILFSGSSQWHFRNKIPAKSHNDFCTLIFFHFIPKGTRPFCEPELWPQYFGVPHLPVIPSRS